MNYMHKFEINEQRAALIFSHFERTHLRLIKSIIGEIDNEPDKLDIGDPDDISMKTTIGHLEDSKYDIFLEWCTMQTLSYGEIQRYIAYIKTKEQICGALCQLIVEGSEGIISGLYCSAIETSAPAIHPDEFISHIIMKDIAEYPTVKCCEH